MIRHYLSIATSPNVVLTSVKVSLFVGTALALINHYPTLVSGSIDLGSIVRILVTYMVPYLVSTYSAVKATTNSEAS